MERDQTDQASTVTKEKLRTKLLGKNIDQLVISLYILENNDPSGNKVTTEMSLEIEMLRP